MASKCVEMTLRGPRCENDATHGDKCYLHAPAGSPPPKLPARPKEAPDTTVSSPERFRQMDPAQGARIQATFVDSQRHVHLRVHFLNAILTDPRVQAAFSRWGKQTKLDRAADAVIRAGKELATAAGVDRWSSLAVWADPIGDEPLTVLTQAVHSLSDADLPAAAESTLPAFIVATDELNERLREYRHQSGSGQSLLNSVGLDWPWLTEALWAGFLRSVRERAYGMREHRTLAVVPGSSQAPNMRLAVNNFQSEFGETIAEVRGRLEAFRAQVESAATRLLRKLDKYEQASVGDRGPKGDTRYLQDWAQWFYRAKVRERPNSPGELAREFKRDPNTVRNGISEAERLLGLAVTPGE